MSLNQLRNPGSHTGSVCLAQTLTEGLARTHTLQQHYGHLQ